MALKLKSNKLVAAKVAKASKAPKSANYRNTDAMARAEMWNCRKLDVVQGGKGIRAGTIVKGVHGYAVATKDVPDVTPRETVKFHRNAILVRKSGKNTTEFDAMVLGNPAKNYCVVRVNGKLANMEVDTFDGQTTTKRAQGKKDLHA